MKTFILNNILILLAVMHEPIDMFVPIDLYEEKNIPKVVKCLASFERVARKAGFKIVIKPITEESVSMLIISLLLRLCHGLMNN